MARGGFSGFPGQNNMQQMMRQAQKLQEKLGEMNESLDAKNYEGTAGGGAVTCSINGKHELVSLHIDPEMIDPEDAEMLQDTIIAAVNDAIKKADDDRNQSMGTLTGGLNLGLF